MTARPMRIERESSVKRIPAEEVSSVESADLSPKMKASLRKMSVTQLFPVQMESISHFTSGRDVVVRSKTGSGKTLAFAIPVVDKLLEDGTRNVRGPPRCLVMTPTRELAKQIAAVIDALAPQLNVLSVYGGTSIYDQKKQLRRGNVSVVVGTPGRVRDLQLQNALDLSQVSCAVLDEADEMLSFGFHDAVEEIYEEMNDEKQNLLFSATMPPAIRRIVNQFLHEPHFIDLVGTDNARIPEGIEMLKIPVNDRHRVPMALGAVLNQYCNGDGRALVFAQTKVECDRLALCDELKCVRAGSIHGDMSQANRERTLEAFRRGAINVLVATDVAARGIDIPGVELVVHASVPDAVEPFIHRTGRTGRAGKKGTNIVVAHPTRDAAKLRNLEKHTKRTFKQVGVPSSTSDLTAIESIAKNKGKTESQRLRFVAERWIDESESLRGLDEAQRASVVSRVAAVMAFSGKFDGSCFSAVTGKYGVETTRLVAINEGEWVSSRHVGTLLGGKKLKNHVDFFPYKECEKGALLDLTPEETEQLRRALDEQGEEARVAAISDDFEVAPYMMRTRRDERRGRGGFRGRGRGRGRGGRGRGAGVRRRHHSFDGSGSDFRKRGQTGRRGMGRGGRKYARGQRARDEW